MTLPQARFDFTADVAPAASLGRVHLIAIGGAGMSGVARIMLAQGLTVSGSDMAAPDVYETTIAPAAVEHEIGVQIDADGRVEFGVTILPDTLPCTGGGY